MSIQEDKSYFFLFVVFVFKFTLFVHCSRFFIFTFACNDKHLFGVVFVSWDTLIHPHLSRRAHVREDGRPHEHNRQNGGVE